MPGDEALIHLRDLAGRPRGTGFMADHHGTVVTSHEAVDGLARLVLYAAGGRTCPVTADAVTPLPALNLALVRTEGLGVRPLPVTVRPRIDTGTYVRIAAGGWREARLLGVTAVTYTATDRLHLLDTALELAIGTAGRDALRIGGGAAGGPVLDIATGTVVAVLGTALRSDHGDSGFAVPLCPASAEPRLAAVLARNAATVPAYGTDLNLAGVLELTSASLGSNGPTGTPTAPVGDTGCWTDGGVARPHSAVAVERVWLAGEFAAFDASPAAVLGLVGDPGSGRTTELAALAARRTTGAEPAPTLWLRGADLRDTDASLADAVHRTLERAARVVTASRAHPPGLDDLTPERLARVARAAGRPLLLLLDGPEEMPPPLAHRLPEWTGRTAKWLTATGARLVVACRAEHWEAAEFPDPLLHPAGPESPASRQEAERCDGGSGGGSRNGTPGRLPSCVRLPDLGEEEARRARAAYGVGEGILTGPDARHPLTLRLLSDVCAALPVAPHVRLDRDDVFAAHLDLMCLRVAVRLAAADGARGTAVRRLAAKVAGQVHEAARRCLGPGRGQLDRETFETVFPRGAAPARLGGAGDWASAVLAEGLIVPAGDGYRFAHEELADWMQGAHLDLDEALRALVHHPRAARDGTSPPVPRHRVGPVVEALLFLARRHGAGELTVRLTELAYALDAEPCSWWAARLLTEVLRRVPDATPYTSVLRLLADRIVTERGQRPHLKREFGPDFWTALRMPEAARFALLRELLLADDGPHRTGPHRTGQGRCLDAVARLLAARPGLVQPLLTQWFDDERRLPATPHATVATAAQALLHTHRRGALDELTEALAASAHRRADELLAVLAEEEPSAVCRAVHRWAHDERPGRRVAAVAYGLTVAPHVGTEADRQLLCRAAEALLARPTHHALHGGALARLGKDPETRARHLPSVPRHFTAGAPEYPPSAPGAALTTHPEPVLEAFHARLGGPDTGAVARTPADVTALVLPDVTALALADVTGSALADRVVALLREAVERWPGTVAEPGVQVERRLEHGVAARAVLLPLVADLLDGGRAHGRTAPATVLAAPGTPVSRPPRRELPEFVPAHELDPAALRPPPRTYAVAPAPPP
ncbi:trypsin-like peptidase domain-containing protein [Streptomyces sp. NPDC005423]|uniref:trypsin-like peptidase domain-containing protein n=1 Tax=Streptomyces sp. NPDC005423 TaxID=3155343 RepID=UPI0033A860C4